MPTSASPAMRAAAATLGGPAYRPALAVGLGFAALYLASASYGEPQSVDTLAMAAPAWSLGQRGTLDVSDFAGLQWIDRSGDAWFSNRLPGTFVWATPWYALLGGSTYSLGPAAIVAALTAALATGLVVVLLDPILGRRGAVAGAVLVGTATSMWTVAADALWTHGPAAVCLLIAMIAAMRSHWTIVALASAAAVLVRPHLAVVAVVLAGAVAWAERRPGPLVRVGVGVAAGMAALTAYQHALWGVWFPLAPSYSGDTRLETGGPSLPLLLQDVAGTLVSPERGVLVFTPVLLVLLAGLLPAWRAAAPWIRGAALGGTAYMAVQLWSNTFTGGSFFYSYRLAIEWLICLIPLLALCWREWTSRTSTRRRVFAALAAISIFTQALGAFGFTAWVSVAGPWRGYTPAAIAYQGGVWRTILALVITAAVMGALVALMRAPTAATRDEHLEGSTPAPDQTG